MNKGLVYALWAYEAQNSDELSFHEGDALTILRRKDESETEWWWARLGEREGYVPKNLLGVSVSPPPKGTLTDTSRAWGAGDGHPQLHPIQNRRPRGHRPYCTLGQGLGRHRG